MNRNFNKALKKTSRGNYFGYYFGFWIFIFMRPHGKWCCQIGKKGKCLWSEGYFGTSLPKLSNAKRWSKRRIILVYTQKHGNN